MRASVPLILFLPQGSGSGCMTAIYAMVYVVVCAPQLTCLESSAVGTKWEFSSLSLSFFFFFISLFSRLSLRYSGLRRHKNCLAGLRIINKSFPLHWKVKIVISPPAGLDYPKGHIKCQLNLYCQVSWPLQMTLLLAPAGDMILLTLRLWDIL